ncbi:MAG: class I SAM-dependent methyltransferase, partial [Pirellulales bacterium]
MSREYEQEYFEQNYRNYARQNPPTKLRFYRNLLESAAPGRTQRRILDIGCAFGVFLGGLDDSWEKFGIDQSQFAIERARHNLPDSTLRVGTATDIPYEGPFDAIVSFDCLEHVEDLDAVRRTISTHLAPDGAILFVVPVYDGPTGPVIRMLVNDPTHVHKRDRWF